jgi:hypothetical protein
MKISDYPQRKPRTKRRWAIASSIPLFAALGCFVVGCCMSPWVRPSEVAKRSADPALLQEEVRALTEDFGTRYYFQDGNMRRCREYIARKFAAAGAAVEEQEYRVKGRKLHNVRVFFGDKSQPRIVVGAHYDSCFIEGDANPGADDNASGVAGLFGVARLLQMEHPEAVCVELVAYSSEEPPYFGTQEMGSYRHAELLSSEGVKVKGALILEMIGYFRDEPHSQQYPTPLLKVMYPSVGNFIAIVGGLPDRELIVTCKEAMLGSAPLPVVSSCLPRSMGSVHLSDHRNYWPFGYPAVMITDTSFYRNPNYHRASDTWDTLDYVRMAHVVTQTHRAVMALGR